MRNRFRLHEFFFNNKIQQEMNYLEILFEEINEHTKINNALIPHLYFSCNSISDAFVSVKCKCIAKIHVMFSVLCFFSLIHPPVFQYVSQRPF